MFRVQFVVSDSEYEELQQRADQVGVSISKYVKDRVFPSEEGSFQDIWEEFCEKLGRFPKDVEFAVSDVMTQERWCTFDRSTKLSIARLFNKKVSVGSEEAFRHIQVVGRSPSNVSLYKKG